MLAAAGMQLLDQTSISEILLAGQVVLTALQHAAVSRYHYLTDTPPEYQSVQSSVHNFPLALKCSECVQISPQTLFLVEGLGQQTAYAVCWGDGFAVDEDFLRANTGSSPRPFFNRLLDRPYLDNVVISPHYYGPSISKSTFE